MSNEQMAAALEVLTKNCTTCSEYFVALQALIAALRADGD